MVDDIAVIAMTMYLCVCARVSPAEDGGKLTLYIQMFY